jgi:GDPmannose 4,6-dehydratase
MKKKIAVIFGGSGQDGTLMAEILIQNGYFVYSVSRISNKKNIRNISSQIKYVKINYYKQIKIHQIIKKTQCTEIYYFAGQPSLRRSYDNELLTIKSHVLPLYYILNSLRSINKKKIKVFNAGSGLIFNDKNNTINERSKLEPKSPYAFSRLISFYLIKYFRINYKINCFTGLFFNHDSFLRSKDHLLPKIINYLKNKLYLKKKLILGEINIYRDWGWAPEYMKIVFKLMQKKKLKDLIIATGRSVSIKYILKYMFKKYNLDWKKFVVSKKYYFLKNESLVTNVSIANLKKFYKLQPKVKIEDMLDMLSSR